MTDIRASFTGFLTSQRQVAFDARRLDEKCYFVVFIKLLSTSINVYRETLDGLIDSFLEEIQRSKQSGRQEIVDMSLRLKEMNWEVSFLGLYSCNTSQSVIPKYCPSGVSPAFFERSACDRKYGHV